MDIVYVYVKKRAEFGRQCNFTDRAAELHVDIAPDPGKILDFIERDPVHRGVQCVPEMSEHTTNTESYEYEVHGINHKEGGWPKDVNCQEVEQVMRYRKKVEKDEGYITAITSMGSVMEHCIKQNNAIDIYEEYFKDIDFHDTDEAPSAKTVNLFRDPNDRQRTASYITWYPEKPSRLAVSYCNLDFDTPEIKSSMYSYIWSIENTNKPEMSLHPPSSLVCIEYNPKDCHIILGGCFNGQLGYWDTRKGPTPVEMTPVPMSHREPVHKAIWIQSKTGNEFFSASSDGKILWWDNRKMSEPTETLLLDPTKKQDPTMVQGAMSLEYEPTIPTKFMVGTEHGTIILCNRKAKSDAEKLVTIYKAHSGPVYAVQRNPFFTKNFLTVGDWQAQIWSEDSKDSFIMRTKQHSCYLSDGSWSPVRPAVFFTTKVDGTLDVWDYLYKQNEPSLTIQVCDEPIHCLKVQEHGHLVACGSSYGTTTLLELSNRFYTMQKNEKNIITEIFERETKREKVLESRLREQKLRVKLTKMSIHQPPPDEEQKPPSAKKVKEATTEFWDNVNKDKKPTDSDKKDPSTVGDDKEKAAPQNEAGAEKEADQ
ncbi:dynein intermediate chain 3, ciliary-like isoform X1 [Octopus sinensis]|uniref:Dynein intermediate chain 3, ciliary-like isoform X1 n=1 Tax=Octopus sinensis TaxID=2607531 RepID=A0A6P7SE43_9MOLL|nr:dynein intermediate chain 3, ciliary-like isoform X1 [Octopus sinensis]